ncbi:DMT family transporter [Litorisediminicola beolgyonensis]|uniref:DMT family transporter n=1 Tax=Litorisediminicola beolgyonensis TaxID=1173614 RepID=A0ABW3ZG08_9RHOB
MHRADRPALGILLILLGVTAISINDMLIKSLSDAYPLHEIVAIRSVLGLIVTLTLLRWDGGIGALRTRTPGLHLMRGLLIVAANMTFYAAVAVLPLAQATALFFVAPLFITLLSIPLLGERVGAIRLAAVALGFLGVLVMESPENSGAGAAILVLPILAALLYALTQVMTRKLGLTTTAAALAVYIQATFILVSLGVYLVAGDGRFAEDVQSDSLVFLLRAWSVPPSSDWPVLVGLGLLSGLVGYCLAASYRLADASVIAPFEYVGLPLAVLWGWLVFGEWPTLSTWAGCALITAAGLVVFLRERQPRPGTRARLFRR